MSDEGVVYRPNPFVSPEDLNSLFSAAWEARSWRDFVPVLRRSLAYVCAYQGENLVGFVNVAWDGGRHAFLLDATVHPGLRLRGIGRELVRLAAAEAGKHGVEWLHVDFEPRFGSFYGGCGFSPTAAGLMRLASG